MSGVFIESTSDSTSTKWDVEAVNAQLGFLQGEVLTIVEAALTGLQLKATKDLIKRAFKLRQDHLCKLSYPSAYFAVGDASSQLPSSFVSAE